MTNRSSACGVFLCGLLLTPYAGAAPGWPSARLPPAAAQQVDAAQFLPAQQLRDWQVDLDRRGLRATGSAAHEGYVDELARLLRTAGVKDVRFEALPMRRWTATHWTLDIVGSADPVAAAAYVPYSGSTPAHGVTAPLVTLPADKAADGALAGKIVLFDLPKVPLTIGYFMKQALYSYDPQNTLTAQTPYVRPHNEIGVIDAFRKRVEAAGAAGAIAILDASPADARGAYYPYDAVLHQVPTLFVDRDAGARLKAAANSGANVRLVLSAEIKDVQTRNLIGIIPGASSELTVINSHTDGTNGVEDNGPNAIIAIAQYLARLPQESLPRSIMVLLTSGHFAGGNGAVDFLNRHRNDGSLNRIAAAITIEHLGAQEWLVDAQGKLAPTGQPEMAAIFTPQVAALVDASSAMLRRADATRSFVLPPQNPQNKGTRGIVWPGEGQYFWGQGDVPTINYISGPSYLLHWGVSTADKVDYERMRRESISFTQMLLDLSRVPVNELR
jgi:PA domain